MSDTEAVDAAQQTADEQQHEEPRKEAEGSADDAAASPAENGNSTPNGDVLPPAADMSDALPPPPSTDGALPPPPAGSDALPPPPAREDSASRKAARSRSRERSDKDKDKRRRSLSRGSKERTKRKSTSRSRSRDRRRGKTSGRSRSRSRDRTKRRSSRSRDRAVRRSRSPRRRSGSRERTRPRSRSPARRSRSPNRSRGRSRSRSASRGRDAPVAAAPNSIPSSAPLPGPPPMPVAMPPAMPPNFAALQAQQALQAQLQAQQAQQALQAQLQLIQAQQAAAAMTAQGGVLGDRRSREIFIGNLNRGLVTADMLRELFNAVLANMVTDAHANPPVITARLDASGKYGFVELRSGELAGAATQLHKMELCGKPMTVERAKGYVDPGTSLAAAAQKVTMAQALALHGAAAGLGVVGFGASSLGAHAGLPTAYAGLGAAALPAAPMAPAMPAAPAMPPPGASSVIMLENVLNVGAIRNDQERRELQTDVYQEAAKFGNLTGICIPVPPPTVPDSEPCRIYIKYGSPADAARCQQTMDGRMFDDNKVKAIFATDLDFGRAQAGEWLPQGASAPAGAPMAGGMAGYPPPPAMAGMAGLPR